MLSPTTDHVSYKDNIDKENKKLKRYYSLFAIGFIANSNIYASGLNESNFYFNKINIWVF